MLIHAQSIPLINRINKKQKQKKNLNNTFMSCRSFLFPLVHCTFIIIIIIDIVASSKKCCLCCCCSSENLFDRVSIMTCMFFSLHFFHYRLYQPSYILFFVVASIQLLLTSPVLVAQKKLCFFLQCFAIIYMDI